MHGNTDHLASRVREIRLEIFGDDGVANLAKSINIPARTWEHFENGVTIPARILLLFIRITEVEPLWLLTGDGERYRIRSAQSARPTSR
jgi:hypothetical protein